MYGSTPTRVIIIFETRHIRLIMASLNVLVKRLPSSPFPLVSSLAFTASFPPPVFISIFSISWAMLAVSISFCNLDFIGCHVIDIRIFKVSILCTFSLLFAVYGGPQLSRQNQKPHGKSKNITAKPKTSRQKQKHHGKTKNLTAKTKYLTAKPNTSQQKQNSFGFAVGIYTVPLTGVRIKRVDFRENI